MTLTKSKLTMQTSIFADLTSASVLGAMSKNGHGRERFNMRERRIGTAALGTAMILSVAGSGACVPSQRGFPMSGILCGASLPEDCTQRTSTYSRLPSETPSSLEHDVDLDFGSSVQGRAARELANRGLWREAAPELEALALGRFGDDFSHRQGAELTLAVARYSLRDYGGAFDLVELILTARTHEQQSSDLNILRGWAANECRTRPALVLLARHHNEGVRYCRSGRSTSGTRRTTHSPRRRSAPVAHPGARRRAHPRAGLLLVSGEDPEVA